MHICMHACMHACIHTYIHTYMWHVNVLAMKTCFLHKFRYCFSYWVQYRGRKHQESDRDIRGASRCQCLYLTQNLPHGDRRHVHLNNGRFLREEQQAVLATGAVIHFKKPRSVPSYAIRPPETPLLLKVPDVPEPPGAKMNEATQVHLNPKF